MRRWIGCVAQAVLVEQRLELAEEVGQVALGFGHRQAAGRQRDAGERVAAQRRGGAHGHRAVRARPAHRCACADRRGTPAMTRFWFGVSRNSARSPARCSNCAISRRPVEVRALPSRSQMRPATMRSVRCQRPSSPCDPAEAVAVVDEGERPRRGEGEPGAAFDFGLEPVQAAIVDRVLQARALAHDAVAEVALRGDHGFGDGDDLVGRDEADHVGQARVGLRIAVGRAHAAADGDVVAGDARRPRGWR